MLRAIGSAGMLKRPRLRIAKDAAFEPLRNADANRQLLAAEWIERLALERTPVKGKWLRVSPTPLLTAHDPLSARLGGCFGASE